MPVTVTAVGSVCDVTIIDENFERIQDWMRSGFGRVDLSGGGIDRYRIQRYSGGQLIGASSVTGFLRNYDRDSTGTRSQLPNSNGILDMQFQPIDGMEHDYYPISSATLVEGDGRDYSMMELLGSPGPSFYFDWQEDGYSEPTAAVGWPPTGWPYQKWPTDLCFSYWLTVPRSSVRVFIPHDAVVKVRGIAVGSLNFFRALATQWQTAANALPSSLNNLPASSQLNKRYRNLARFALFVDCNPLQDGFENINPNIASDEVSWQKITDVTVMCPQRMEVAISGEVFVRGGRWYNFSLKTRDAAKHGYVDSLGNWGSGNYESTDEDYTQRSAAWKGRILTELGFVASAGNAKYAWYPNWFNLWETTGIEIEADYGRTEAYQNNTNDAEFDR